MRAGIMILYHREKRERERNWKRDQTCVVIILSLPGGEGKKERNKHWRRKGGNSRPEKDYPFDPSF